MRKSFLVVLFAVHGIVLLTMTAAAAQPPKVVLGSFHGKFADQEIFALCWAITPPGATAIGVDKICYVRIAGKKGEAETWQRNDDSDFSLPIRDLKLNESPKVVSWAKERHVNFSAEALGVLSNPRALEKNDLWQKLAAASEPPADFHEQSLAPNYNEPDEFVKGAGDFLDEWSLVSKVEEPKTEEPQTRDVDSVQLTKEPAATLELARSLLRHIILLIVIVTLVALLLFFATVIFRLVQLWPDDWPGLIQWLKAGWVPPEWVRPDKASVASPSPGKRASSGEKATKLSAEERLVEALKIEGVQLGTSDLAADLLERTRARLAKVAGPDNENSRIDTLLERIERYLANIKFAGSEIPANMAAASILFMDLTNRLETCKVRLDGIPVEGVEPVQTWADTDFLAHFDLKCEEIKKKLAKLDAMVACFKTFGYKEENVLTASEQAVTLCRQLQGELPIEGLNFSSAQAAVGALLRDCIALADSDRGDTRNATKSVAFVRSELAERKKRIEELERDKGRLENDLKGWEGVFPRGGDETSIAAAQRVADEPKKALDLLKMIRGMAPEKLVDGVSTLTQRLEMADKLVREFLPDAPDPIHEAVKALVTRYEAVSKELKVRTKLTQELRSYLYLSQDGPEGAELVRKAIDLLRDETVGAHRALRLGLGSVLAVWGEGVKRTTARLDVLAALRLEDVEKELRELLWRVENASEKALGVDLENGFPRDWLHQLFRAEVILDTYFAELEPCSLLRDAVKLAGGTLRIALHHYDCHVMRLDLLKPNLMLRVSEKRIQRERDAPLELRRIPEVRARVAPYLESNDRNIFVDIRSFVYFKGNDENWHFEVVEITPADWRA